MRLRYTVEARSHIKAIYDYLAERNPTAALESRAEFAQLRNCCRTFPELAVLELILERPSGS